MRLARLWIVPMVFGLLLSGCTTVHSEHAWHQRPNLPAAKHAFWTGLRGQSQEVLDEWIEIPGSQYEFVRPEMRPRAAEMLKEKSFVPLPPNEIRSFCAKLMDTSPSLTAYLARGLSYSPEYDWAHVFQEKASREVWVQTVTYNLELSLPGMSWKITEKPVVILLDAPPSRIAVTAHLGGDYVLGSDGRFEGAKWCAFWLVELDYPLSKTTK